jgi:hypothetical protein
MLPEQQYVVGGAGTVLKSVGFKKSAQIMSPDA